jgi:phage tail protein X
MANPNIIGISSVYGNTIGLIPSTTSATNWTALTPAANTVYKIDSITATNVTGSAAAITLAVNSGVAGAGTNFRLAYQISIPPYAALIITDKSTAFYMTETQSIVVTVGTASAIELVATYESFT